MKLTLKQDINTNSLMLKHNILTQASELVMGREGALQTEKDLYLIMALADNVIEEDLMELCNEDERNLNTIFTEDIEPLFKELMNDNKYVDLYIDMKELFLSRCKEIWDNQHSFYGVLDAILTMIASMDDDDKKEVLTATAKVAEQAFERRTETMTKKTNEVNDKLSQLVNQYIKTQAKNIEEKEEEKENNDTTE